VAKFGWNPFPRKFGGGQTVLESEHQNMLDRFAPGWDASYDTINWIECYTHALAISMIWAVNNRLKGQAIPSKMLEALPDWEDVLRLRPLLTDTVQARRRAVAAKLRGLAGNAMNDILAVIEDLAGSAFVELRTPTLDQTWVYWPGMNPGPPGFEWSSNRALMTIVLSRNGISNADYFNVTEQLTLSLNALIPSWMSFTIGEDSGSGFIPGVGVPWITIL
jgi:uncharacterized protein YmfQ (DUF2313 family)